MKLFPSSRADAALRPDLCVVGAGAAGSAAALAGAALGARVVVVEAQAEGGEAGRYEAALAIWRRTARRRAEGGGAVGWAEIAAQAGAAAARAGAATSALRLRAAGVAVVEGRGRFVGRDRLAAGGVEIVARRFVVATGRAATAPAAPGLDLIRPLSPAAALALAAAPEQVAILGLGPTGLALAQIFARLGAPVAAIGAGVALPGLSREFAEPALRRLRAEGVRIVEGAEIAGIEPAGTGALLRLRSGETIRASHVVAAGAERPQIEGLGLEAAGVASDADGISTRADLRSAARRVYAAGAVVSGAAPDGETAARMGRLAARSALLGLPGEARLDAAATRCGLDPDIWRIGRDETAPGARVLRAAFGEDAETRAAGPAEGHLAVTVDARGRILGATLVGRDVEATAAALSLAMARGLDVAALAQAPLPGVGGLAALARALGADLARQARGPAAARLLRWRRRMP